MQNLFLEVNAELVRLQKVFGLNYDEIDKSGCLVSHLLLGESP